jgi:phosphoribosylanthranilate isomerase (EC 5.3.1.24)
MIVKVCGMRDADNIREVAALGVDMIGFIFWPKSPRCVQLISSQAGIIPDYSEERYRQAATGQQAQTAATQPQRVGVFVGEMPQTIVSYVYNYGLDYVQLHGQEKPVMIENLKHTLIPDIAPRIKIIKALSIRNREDVRQYKAYEGVADLLLFDTKCETMGGSGEQFAWQVLDAYDGNTPFLLSGGIGPDDVEKVKAFAHPKCLGVDLNSRFETEPGRKDVERLRNFLQQIR